MARHPWEIAGSESTLRASAASVRLVAAARNVAAAFLLLAAATVVQAQISPGQLSKAHQSLSGTTQCTTCHTFGVGSTSLKCQQCHTEIAQAIAQNHGLHARYPNKEQCEKCHSEHNGEDFPLIRWQPSLKAFDHSQTGYALQGKHASLACAQCHTAAHIRPAERSVIKMKDLNQSFLGLTQDCVGCHDDVHKGQLGQNCLQCHNYVDWKAATKFDHSKTRFALTGLHAAVSCEKCHAPPATGQPARFTGMAFAKCSDCHSDPHHGSFAQSCETCHTTAGWKKILPNQQFDHSKTQFPLLGKHAQVDCIQCHAGGNFKKPVAFAKCSECHTTDPHSGQFAGRADKGECSSCHTVEGWKPSLFAVKDHARTAYPLDGKHAAVSCDKCHVPAGAATVYKIAFTHCTDCHKDAHAGQFAQTPWANQCEKCHTVKGFEPSTYTLAQHQKSRFPLGGAHLAVTCVECHTANKGSYAASVVPYHFEDRTCTGCHQNPHGDEFRAQMSERRADGSAKGCEACHNVRSWLDLPSFDHSKTHFPLIGAHQKVQCDQCHMPEAATGKFTEASFKSTPTDCAACHMDPHAGQFTKDGKAARCETCHSAEHWKPSLFNHDTQTDFSLKGGHVGVACEKCHTGARMVAGTRVVFYRPTPRDCASCHF